MYMYLKAVEAGFERIKSATGKEKQDVLEDIFDRDPDTAEALFYLLNPMYSYGIGEKSLNRHVNKSVSRQYYSLRGMLDHLNQSVGVTDQMLRDVQHFISENEEHRALIVGMLTKSITLGVTAKTVNKSAGYTYIPTMEIQLAEKYFDHQNAVHGKSFTLTEKLDGNRCVAVIHNGAVKLFTRQGQPVYGLVDVESDLLDIYKAFDQDLVFDGELLITDRDSIPSKEQYKQTMKIVRSDGEKHGITYHIFDVVEYDGFCDKECRIPYYMRRQRLDTFVGNAYKHLEVVPVLYSGTDESQIAVHLAHQREIGHEGVMINLNDAVYEYKRTTKLLKVKAMQDCDLKIAGLCEGKGKYSGTLGALMVEYKGNLVGVGSGLTDDMRKAIWSDRQSYLGRIVTVQYFEETQDAEGKPSLRFPVFLRLRDDKTEPSYH